jgi:hypothetical protein
MNYMTSPLSGKLARGSTKCFPNVEDVIIRAALAALYASPKPSSPRRLSVGQRFHWHNPESTNVGINLSSNTPNVGGEEKLKQSSFLDL